MQEDDIDSTMNFGPMVNPDDIWIFRCTDDEVVASSSGVNILSLDSTEIAQQDQPFTSLLSRDEPSSTVVHSTTDSMYDFYTDQIPESTLSTSAPGTNDFQGSHDFQVTHPKEDGTKASKSASWTYSSISEELYVKMNVDCPLLFKIKGSLPLGTQIRATPVYTRAEDTHNFPKRCLNHSAEQHETNRGFTNSEHLIRCCLVGTHYTKDEATGRMSTILPFVPPEFRSSLSTYVVRFMCRTSCPGGMNRRPMSVAFTLEHNGKCLGRQTRKVKVCACPGRDRQTEEARIEKLTLQAQTYEDRALAQDVKRACKRIGTSLSSNSEPEAKQCKNYTITVSSRAHYNILTGLIPILQRFLGTNEDEEEEEVEG